MSVKVGNTIVGPYKTQRENTKICNSLLVVHENN